MKTEARNNQLELRLKLSSLWIFVFFNMIFRDLHEFGRPGFIEEMMTGVVDGVQITESLMLIGSFMIEIPLLMLPLTQFLKSGANRIANMFGGGFTILTIIMVYSRPDLDDIFFAVFEITALVLIVWYAWRSKDSVKSLQNTAFS